MMRLVMAESQRERLADSWQPVNRKGEALGFFLLQQIAERFRTQGASSGTAWAPKKLKAWGYDDGRSILTGATARLKDSFQSIATATAVTVFSDVPYAATQQFGATIKPKTAKALFIPITDRAITSQRLSGPAAAHVRFVYGHPRLNANAYRVATRGKKYSSPLAKAFIAAGTAGGVVFSPLVRGRLNKGKLEKWDEKKGEYVQGVPDFIFLSKVTIKPRPMLPDSADEQAAQAEFIADLYQPEPFKVN